MCFQNDFPDWRTQLSESHVTCAILTSRLTDSDKQDDRPTAHRSKHDTGNTILRYQQGHLHILKLEVVLEGVGRDEPQLAKCDRAGEDDKAQ